MDGQPLFERVIDSIEAALAQSREVKGRFPQGFGRYCAGVDVCAAREMRPFHKCHPFAKVRGLRGALLACRSGADYDQVVVCHVISPGVSLWPKVRLEGHCL